MTAERHRSSERWLGILQPVFLPWLGYFEQMTRVDHFVFQEDVQYTRHDWRNRNRIKTAAGPAWLTVPVHSGGQHSLIKDISVDYGRDWVGKHVRSIEQAYARAPRVRDITREYAEIVSRRPDALVDLTIPLVAWLARELGVRTTTSRASDVPRGDDVDLNGRILEIARFHGATHLYLGAKAAEYVPPSLYEPHGIEVVFQDYPHPTYPQLHGDFLSHMSALDLLINVPQSKLSSVLGWGG